MGVTIYDLAREAGVGIGTVSRCMNNHPNVSPGTREKVLSIAQRLNYQPHVYARGLASKKTNTVSIVIPYFTNYFFMEVLRGVQDKASDIGVDLMLYGVNNPSEADYYLRRSLHQGHVDGVLFFSMSFPESFVTRFKELKLPLVLVDACHPDFDSIQVRNRDGARIATAHLVQLGHRRIAMINGSLETQPAQERLAGYRDALEQNHLPFEMDDVRIACRRKQDGFTREWGFAAMRSVIRSRTPGHPISAVFVASDVQAIGALEAARELGVGVPDEIAMVGYDDIELAGHLGLTTMRQPMYDMGVLAVETLMTRIKSPEAPPRLSTFTPELVVRRTCGARHQRTVPSDEEMSHIQLEQSSA